VIAYLAAGGVAGLTWAAALRGWMVQLTAGASSFSWLTFLLVLLPGLAVGVLLGWAADLRAHGRRPPRALVFAPAVFATALLDPTIFAALIRNGQGGGALIVVTTALTGGFVLARRGPLPARAASGLIASAGVLLLGGMGGMAAPLTTPRGAWVCVYGLSLILLLCLAASLPYAGPSAAPGRVPAALLGGLCGLAWSCALRAFMSEVAGDASEVHWVNTFVFVLLPGVLCGAILGWTAGTGRRLPALSPLLFAAVLLSNPFDLPALFQDGIGGGAIGVPLFGILGGYALCDGGPVHRRAAAGAAFLAGPLVWALTATDVGGPGFALTTPHGLWAATLFTTLLVALAWGVSQPLRQRHPAAATAGRHPSAATL
jgi:hypothetical protein